MPLSHSYATTARRNRVEHHVYSENVVRYSSTRFSVRTGPSPTAPTYSVVLFIGFRMVLVSDPEMGADKNVLIPMPRRSRSRVAHSTVFPGQTERPHRTLRRREIVRMCIERTVDASLSWLSEQRPRNLPEVVREKITLWNAAT